MKACTHVCSVVNNSRTEICGKTLRVQIQMWRLLLQLKNLSVEKHCNLTKSYLNTATNLGVFEFQPLQGLHALILLVVTPATQRFQGNGVRLQKLLLKHFKSGTGNGDTFHRRVYTCQFLHFFCKCFHGLG